MAGSKPLVLPDDFSIDIEESNPFFNDNEMFSYPVSVPIDGNREWVGNMDDIQSDIRPVDLEFTQMRILVDGMPFRSGVCVSDDEQEIDGEFSFSITAQRQSLDDIVGQLECRDVPVRDRIQIGEKIGNVKVNVDYTVYVTIQFGDGKKPDYEKSIVTDSISNEFNPQALGYSFPGICETEKGTEKAIVESVDTYSGGIKVNRPKVVRSFINTSEEYSNSSFYCNARVCYTHYELDDNGRTSDNVQRNRNANEYDPYWVLDADRPQSGICFYVLYFFDCLFHYLGYSFDKTALTNVGDLKRLVFFTTRCKYDTERKYPEKEVSDFTSYAEINQWLSSRGCGGKLSLNSGGKKQIQDGWFDGEYYEVGKNDILSITCKPFIKSNSVSADILNMYANSENFPDASVSEILDAMWNTFGVKFIMDYETKQISAVLIRDIYRSNEKPVRLSGTVLSVHKVSEKVTGVRMRYSAESDPEEQTKNIRYGVKDYDTDFDYTDYRKVDSSLSYYEIIHRRSTSDVTCYIDRSTGNAYRLKVNADADTASDLKPAWFEVGAYKGVEVGDCSKEMEDFVVEFTSDFMPVVFNDINVSKEMDATSGKEYHFSLDDGRFHWVSGINTSCREQLLAAFIDEDMEHEFVEQRIKNLLGADLADINLMETLSLKESYDPTKTEDGNSPLQEYDWGNSIAVMRGGGTDSQVQLYDYDYDGCGNSKWRTVSGKYAVTSDSVDNWGNEYDYNGVLPGVGTDERFSLKIRAFKEVDGEILCNEDIRDENGAIVTKIRSRGLFDTFMAEHAHFLLNRKKYIIRVRMEIAVINEISNHWDRRFEIGGIIGWVNKIRTSLSVARGVEEVEIEMYSL